MICLISAVSSVPVVEHEQSVGHIESHAKKYCSVHEMVGISYAGKNEELFIVYRFIFLLILIDVNL